VGVERTVWDQSVGAGADEVFGGLTHLPVAVGERAFDRGHDLRTIERSEGENGAAADGGLVGTGGEDRRQPALVTDRAERGGGRLADERLVGRRGERDEPVENLVGNPFALTARPGGDLDDARVRIVEGPGEIHAGMCRGQLGGAATHGRHRITERGGERGVVERAEPLERAEGDDTNGGVLDGEPRPRDVGVSLMAGGCDGARRRCAGHRLSKLVSVVTAQATPNAITVAATAPVTTASPPLAPSASRRRNGPGRRCDSVSRWSTAIGGRVGSMRLRPVRCCALTVFRHPVSTRATTASPAIQAARVVSPSTESAKVTDTQSETILVPAETEVARPAVRRPRSVHRWWAFPLIGLAMVLLLAIGVAAVLPSSLVAEEENPVTQEMEPTPYARTPASAEAVDDRITFGDLEGAVEQYPPSGDIYFVTVTEPSQSVLSWLVGQDEPAVQFLSEEEKFGLQTPQQRRVLALESMRSAEEVAQYVALRAVGYDASIVPGDVLIEQMVCLEPNDDGTACVRWSPSDEFLDPGDRLLAIDGVELHGVEDITELLAGKEPGETVDIRIERPEVGELTVTVELTQSPTEPERTIIGFIPFDTRRVELPFELDIDTGQIGGPSAGLAFTLTLVDELTPGELTGGGDVAVTGTIELDGSIGAIGGLRQKASAVAQAGVDVFLVPTAQGPEDIAAARDAVDGEVEIIPVATLDEALAALESLDGDPIETQPIPETGG
jgi:Lon-like protease